ncbi:MAG: hypothetical protein C3F02_02940 [Parcubacteria group bacterium]|nr:MAG: hypothetical protein C3F02_02940 [Parcubacteria group bacterium]
MPKQATVGMVPGTVLGTMSDILLKIKSGVITPRELDLFAQRQNPFAINSIQEEWQEFYRKYFRLSVDFSDVSIPEEQEDFTRVLFIPQGLTINQAFQACSKAFKSWSYTNDLDKDVPNNDRNTEASYAIRVRDRVEADEELKNLSANDLQKRKISSITLLERLVYELKYYSETNKHLDIQNTTLCAGSRHRNGSVPCVYWSSGLGKLCVDWCHPDSADDGLRGRAVVS